jgi:NADH:ubiquinone oxidoreductase subunit F (NADH-binding)
LLELPTGLPVAKLLQELTGEPNPPLNVLVGGFFGGIIPVSTQFDLSYDGLKVLGGGLGCGSLHFLDPSTCVLSIAADVVAFYAQNNARQCRTCMSSTDAIANFLAGAGRPRPDINLGETLTRWSTQLPGRGACAVPDGVALLLRTLLRHYPQVIASHQQYGCEACAMAPLRGRWEHLSITQAGSATDRTRTVDNALDLERAR